MLSIESDIVKLDQDLIKIVKIHWPNILFCNIECGLHRARDVAELGRHGGNVVGFRERAYTRVFWPLLQK